MASLNRVNCIGEQCSVGGQNDNIIRRSRLGSLPADVKDINTFAVMASIFLACKTALYFNY